jgi:hypothetical protein
VHREVSDPCASQGEVRLLKVRTFQFTRRRAVGQTNSRVVRVNTSPKIFRPDYHLYAMSTRPPSPSYVSSFMEFYRDRSHLKSSCASTSTFGGVKTSGRVIQVQDDDEEDIVPASPRMTGGF